MAVVGPDVSLVFTCRACGRSSQWTANTRAPFCFWCRCAYHVTPLEGVEPHRFCRACMVEAGELELPDEDEDGVIPDEDGSVPLPRRLPPKGVVN